MHLLPALGAGVCAVALAFALQQAGPEPDLATASTTAPAPVADGHDVLVVEGDRNALAITFAAHKADPCGAPPKDLRSDWKLVIRDAQGATLTEVPLDVAKFATGAADVGSPRRVEGCIVTDARIAILVNAPTFASAASYEFLRGDVSIGRATANRVRQLAGGGR